MNDQNPFKPNYGTLAEATSLEFATLPSVYNDMCDGFDTPNRSSSGATARLLLPPEDSRDVFSTDSQPLEDISIPGYEHVTLQTTSIDPPPPLLAAEDGSFSHRPIEDVPHMTDTIVRDAVLAHVSSNICWGLTAAREMTILDIIPSSAFKYELETCTERRTAIWEFEPYTGQLIDTSNFGASPKPWDVLVVPPNPYQNGQVTVEVPHSARIINCHDCSTLGRRKCWSCFGNGEIACTTCNESGLTLTNSSSVSNSCLQCNGVGRRRCVVCLGPGQLPCKTCLARGKLKICLKMTVSWKIYGSERVVEHTSMPPILLNAIQGRLAFQEEKAAVWPINFFPDEAVNHASRELLDQHRLRYSAEKTMLQRHAVRLVPIYQIAYLWREHRDYFYIYGYDNLVYFPGYPQRSCCGISEYLCNIS